LPVFFLVIPVIFLLAPFLQAQGFPLVTRLDAQDVMFKQYTADVEAARRAVYSRYPVQSAEDLARYLTIYEYKPKSDDDLLLISARCNVPYDALVTLNRWSNMMPLSPERPVLLPSMPGIFVPSEPSSDLERLVFSSRDGELGALVTINLPKGGSEQFRFIPGDSFTPNERSFFLNPALFRFPLSNFRLTSPFGVRISPINGKTSMHGGLDLAAPSGTSVYAARDGVVTYIGENRLYGKHIIITHNGNWSSLYGHLSAINTSLNSNVKSGTIIGKVGSTGLSTGPHLHFELKQNGKVLDPSKVLKGR
jgi:hypothetical protein